jgi:hypothetical protein
VLKPSQGLPIDDSDAAKHSANCTTHDVAKDTNAECHAALDMLLTIEFVSWVMLGLVPFLRYVNGPAVTSDQFAVHCAITSLAVLGAILSRLAIRRRLTSRRE